MRDLFDPRTGDGLNFLRQPIGASDFVAKNDYTYDDRPAGKTDYAQRHFTIRHDRKAILPLLRQAQRINRHITIMATPWSPPAWMKTNQSLVGGRLIDDPRIYRSFALYLVKFVRAYQRAGVPVDYLTVQNEPQNRAPSGYPGTDMSAAQEEKVIMQLGPDASRRRICTPRSSATTTTGPSTRTTSRTPRPTSSRTSTTTRRNCSARRRRATSRAPRTTATTAIPAR